MYNRGKALKLWGIVAVILLTTVASGFSIDLTLSEFVSQAVAESSAIADAEEAAEEALDALSPGYDFDALRLSLSGSGRYTPDPAPTQDPFAPSASANLSIPVIPQISLSAQVSTNFETVDSSYSLSISPLASRKVTYRERKAYEMATLQLVSLAVTVPYQFEQAAYCLILAELSAATAKDKLALEESEYNVSKEQYEIGDLGWSQYNAAVDSYSSAQRGVFDAERSELSARRQLTDLVGITLGSATLVAPEIDAIESELNRRKNRIETEEASALSTGVITAEIELRSLEGELKATPVIEPTLSISANANLPFTSVNGSVSFTLSPAQYNGDKRDDLKHDIEDKSEDLEIEKLSLEFEINMIKRQIESAERLYATSVTSVESARIAFEEAEFLHAEGDRTDTELEEARLNLDSANQNRYKNAVNLLSVYDDLLQLIDIGNTYRE
jgi:hypothetical protein